jgi:hypothetical protein
MPTEAEVRLPHSKFVSGWESGFALVFTKGDHKGMRLLGVNEKWLRGTQECEMSGIILE